MAKVWCVEFGWDFNIHSKLFLTEQEALNEYQSLPEKWYRNMYQTNDIWGWAKRQAR